MQVNWLGGRDSNPDNVVQRAASGLQCVSFRSVLFRFSVLGLRQVLFRSALFTRQRSHCVSGLSVPALRRSALERSWRMCALAMSQLLSRDPLVKDLPG
jgi:hypothetical protein